MHASWFILLCIITIPCDKIREDKTMYTKKPQLDNQEHLSTKTGPTNIKAMGVSSHIFPLVASAFHMVANHSSLLTKTMKNKTNKMTDDPPTQ